MRHSQHRIHRGGRAGEHKNKGRRHDARLFSNSGQIGARVSNPIMSLFVLKVPLSLGRVDGEDKEAAVRNEALLLYGVPPE